MFLVRRAIWLLRLYTNVLLVGVMIVAVDVNMQAKAVGRDLASYDRQAYIETVQRRLRGEDGAGLLTPLDATMMTYRGVLRARLAIMGLDAEPQDFALLPDTTSAPPLHKPNAPAAADEDAKPCVRRNNVLSC